MSVRSTFKRLISVLVEYRHYYGIHLLRWLRFGNKEGYCKMCGIKLGRLRDFHIHTVCPVCGYKLRIKQEDKEKQA